MNAVDIANRVAAVIAGEPSAEVLMALSMVLGAAEARAARPDFENLMALVREAAHWQFQRSLAAEVGGHA